MLLQDDVLNEWRNSTGIFPPYILEPKFGFNLGLGSTSVDEEVWSFGGERTFNPINSPFTAYIASTSVNDVGNLIDIIYHNENNELKLIEGVTLNGQTPVEVSGVSMTESFRMFVSDDNPSPLEGNVNLAKANNFTAGVPDNQNEALIQIPLGYNQSQALFDRVPAGCMYHIIFARTVLVRDGALPGSAICSLEIKNPNANDFRGRVPILLSTSAPFISDVFGIILDEGTTFRTRVKSCSDNNSRIAGTYIYEVAFKKS